MKIPYLLTLCIVTTVFAGCQSKTDQLDDHLRGNSWVYNGSGSCAGDDGGTVTFSAGGTGNLSLFTDCQMGQDCYTLLKFEWTIDAGTDILLINYVPNSTQNTYQVCSQDQTQSPPSETIPFSKTTTSIVFLGYTFTNP